MSGKRVHDPATAGAVLAGEGSTVGRGAGVAWHETSKPASAMISRIRVVALACGFALISTIFLHATPSRASALGIQGTITDATTGAVIPGACVTLGPPITCFTHTDGNGVYFVDLEALAAQPGQTWDMYFLKAGYQTSYSGIFTVSTVVEFNQPLKPSGLQELCPAPSTAAPTQTVYLPNLTKTLGGASGWQTPFIVQNTGSAPTQLEITFLRFLNSQCVVRRTVQALAPGTSVADVPNNDTDLPGNTQFAVVVKSFGSNVVAVVNEQAGGGDRSEAMAYDGLTQGATNVFLPNITRRFFGYVTPFIIQNLSGTSADVTARFVSFDGTVPSVAVQRSIPAGASKFVDPNSDDKDVGAPGLVDGKQYAVTVTSSQPVSVVVNTQNDARSDTPPLAYSTDGIVSGAALVYGAYGAKNAAGVGRVSTIVLQNMGATTITPSLAFLRLATTGAPQLFTSPNALAPGAAWAFDPRFTLGTITPCSTPSSTCLPDGEYSFVARAGSDDGRIAVVVNLISPTTAMGYAGSSQPAARYFLPNVTRTLCACPAPAFDKGWTTPILLQSVTASAASVKWFRFSDGQLVTTQRVDLPSQSAIRIDPRTVSGLTDDTQFAVVVEGIGGTVSAIVTELAPGGDNAMAYEGFPDPAAIAQPGPAAGPTPAPTASPQP
jgi:hypothetical protein